jgi:hypothetical protein
VTVSEEARSVREGEAQTLGEIGAVWSRVELPDVEVHLPRALAEAAVAAWNRDDLETVEAETVGERLARHRAGSLALIGLAVTEGGRWEPDAVVVSLNAGLIALAVEAADDLPAD